MSKRLLIALAGAALLITALTATSVAAPPQMFVTPLSGGEEVPPRDTQARGVAIFQVRGDEVSYRLIASNITNVVQAHIHLQVPGENGPIVQWLHPDIVPPADPAGGGRQDGVLATGTFTASTFIGPLEGMPMSALVEMLRNGGAYVNVHTNDGVDPPNTGPGDFPGGEIRGQVD
jgi:hypothetical protein